MPVDTDELWVFGYGSLMWRPGFAFLEKHVAMVRGYHRWMCIHSHVHRGTPQRPGLVLGLDRGGSCRGIAFLIAPDRRLETIAYLRAREQVTMVYREARVRAVLIDGRPITALTYLVDRNHPQYAGRLDRPTILSTVRQAVGQSGANPDYVRATHQHLAELGLEDPTLAWLAAELER